VAPLYGWADPNSYYPVDPVPEFEADLSYLGTYAADRQVMLEELLMRPACALPDHRFLIAGAMFPQSQNRPANVTQLDHVPPQQHRAFFCSTSLSLNVTRGSMAAMGYCPSGRLFEAGACGTPILSDWWTGLDEFFQPGEEILIATSCAESIRLIISDPGALKRIGSRARQRVLDCHTTEIRARQLIDLIESPVNQNAALEPGLAAAYKGA
jgi:spore maturation protein CgeB